MLGVKKYSKFGVNENSAEQISEKKFSWDLNRGSYEIYETSLPVYHMTVKLDLSFLKWTYFNRTRSVVTDVITTLHVRAKILM